MRSVVPPGDRDLTDEDLEDLYRPAGTGRHVRANFVTAVDGAVEVDGRTGGLGSDDDHRVFATLRALADVVLVGAETVRREGYGPARVAAGRRRRREARGQRPLPVVAVVTARALLDPQARLFAEGGEVPRTLVVTCEAASPERRRALAEVAEVVTCGGDSVDLAGALALLGARDLDRVLCEGGPTLVTQMMAGGLLDELCVTQSPLIAGPGRGQLTAGDSFASPIPLHLEGLLAGDGALAARYRIEHGRK